jgi:hypothetical protein
MHHAQPPEHPLMELLGQAKELMCTDSASTELLYLKLPQIDVEISGSSLLHAVGDRAHLTSPD